MSRPAPRIGRRSANRDVVRVVRVYRTDPETLFRTWTEPALLERWFAPSEGVSTEAVIDLQVGGRWRVGMGRRVASGIYLEIARPHRLVFTWLWEDAADQETVVTVELVPRDSDSTRLILTHRQLPVEVDCMGFEAGWKSNLARLAALVDSPGSVRAKTAR